MRKKVEWAKVWLYFNELDEIRISNQHSAAAAAAASPLPTHQPCRVLISRKANSALPLLNFYSKV